MKYVLVVVVLLLAAPLTTCGLPPTASQLQVEAAYHYRCTKKQRRAVEKLSKDCPKGVESGIACLSELMIEQCDRF